MRVSPAIALLGAMAATACDSGGSPTEPTPVTATLTVNAANDTVYVDLNGNTAQLVSVSNPAQANNWDLGLYVTSVMLNGGTNGPGGVVGYCICQNASASSDQVMAFSPSTELPDFEAITAAQAPATAGSWAFDVFNTSRWYRYNLTGNDHQVWPTFDVYLIKTGGDLYKLQITNYYGPGGEPRQITLRYARLLQ